MPIKESISAREVVDFLNHLLEIDESFTTNLVMTRFKCNDKLICHPSVQHITNTKMTGAYAGFLGVLNGLFGVDDKSMGPIHACIKDGKLLKFVTKDEEFDFNKVAEHGSNER